MSAFFIGKGVKFGEIKQYLQEKKSRKKRNDRNRSISTKKR